PTGTAAARSEREQRRTAALCEAATGRRERRPAVRPSETVGHAGGHPVRPPRTSPPTAAHPTPAAGARAQPGGARPAIARPCPAAPAAGEGWAAAGGEPPSMQVGFAAGGRRGASRPHR